MASPVDGGDLMAQIRALMGGGELSDEERKSQRQQAAFAAAAGLLSNMYKPTGVGLGAGIGAGLLGYNEAGQSMRRDKLANAQNLHAAIQSQGMLQSMNDDAQYRKVRGEQQAQSQVVGPPLPSMAPTPANAAALPAARASQNKTSDFEQAVADAKYLESKNVAQKYIDQAWAKADKLRPKFSTTPQTSIDPVTKQPYQYVLDESGNEKRLGGGVVPKFREITDNKVTKLINEYNVPSEGLSVQMQTTPSSDQSNATARAGQAQSEAHFQAAQGNAASTRVGNLRQEFNGLPQVKAFNEVQPVLQSAREAAKTDTAPADLNLIYATAKIMDPGSVVRESETTMVVKAGSPAERLMGQFNYVAGGGRLTEATRKQLMAQIESRAKGFETGYNSARKAYEGVATKQGIPHDQVFIEPFAGSEKAGGAVQIKGDADFAKLPSGAEFIGPDGKRRRKP